MSSESLYNAKTLATYDVTVLWSIYEHRYRAETNGYLIAASEDYEECLRLAMRYTGKRSGGGRTRRSAADRLASIKREYERAKEMRLRRKR